MSQRVLVGVTGSIAAYKAVYLVRRLQEQGWQVRVLMTPEARHFIGPLTFEGITRQPVYWDFLKTYPVGSDHVDLTRWADWMVIAPATAHTIAALAHGLAHNFLVATAMAMDPLQVLIAPAMETGLWNHSATQENIQRLQQFGYHILMPQEGALASGQEGIGRMQEPEQIVDFLIQLANKKKASPVRPS